RRCSGAAPGAAAARRRGPGQGVQVCRLGTGCPRAGRGGPVVRLILVATGVGLLIGLFGTPLLIRLLRRHGYAQAIRDGADGYPVPAHESKRCTPSIGGAVLVVRWEAG